VAVVTSGDRGREGQGQAHGASVQLEIREISKSFGGVQAVSNVTLDIRKGSVTSIIGPNGAGKTTVLNMISGFYHPDRGAIRLDGADITHVSPSRIAARGVARTFQNIALRFADYGYILENGRIVLDGAAAALRANEDVKEFYLGLSGSGRKSYREVKHYKRRKRWLA